LPADVLFLGTTARSVWSFRGPFVSRLRATGRRIVAVTEAARADDLEALHELGVVHLTAELERAAISPLGDLRYLLRLRQVMVSECPEYVVAYGLKQMLYAAIAIRLLRVKPRLMLIFAGMGRFSSWSRPKRTLVDGVLEQVIRMMVRSADVVVAQNRDLGTLLERSFNARHVVRVAGSGVSLTEFAYRPPSERSPMLFLMVARALRSKGVYEFVEAAKIVNELGLRAQFVLIGPEGVGPGGISRSELYDLEGKGFSYAGEVSDVRPWIYRCSAVVLPSYYGEGIPRSLLEALSCGRPVVTTDWPGCREAVVNGRSGLLVDPRSVPSLVRALQHLIANRSVLDVMSREARSLAKARFSDEDVARDMVTALLEA